MPFGYSIIRTPRSARPARNAARWRRTAWRDPPCRPASASAPTPNSTKFVRTLAGSSRVTPGIDARASASRRALAWSSASRSIIPVGSVAQGDQPGRGDDPGLAHPAAHQLAGATGAGDERGVADDERSDRAGQALRQAERGGRARRQEVAGRHAEGDRRVEQPRPIDEQRNADARAPAPRRSACTPASAAGPSTANGCSRA